MKKINTLLLMTLIVLFLDACKTTRIIPDKPTTGNLPERPERLNSQISLPMEIDISTIEAFINQKLPSGKIEGGSGRSGNTTRYSYQVYRNKPVKFSASGNELIFKVPINIKAQGSYTACIGFWRDGDCCSTPKPFGSGCLTSGITSTEHGNASPTVDIELRIKLEIQEDYSIKAKTYLKGGVSGDTHLHIDLIGNLIRINISIKDKLEKMVKKFVADYQAQINEKVTSLVSQYNIKNEIAKFWTQVKQPISMGDFWLDMQPQKVIFENLNAQNKKLKIAVGFASKLQIMSKKPIISNLPLPNLTIANNTKGEFNIHLPANANFDQLEKKVENLVTGKKYEKNGIWVKIRGLNVQGVRLNNTSALLLDVIVKGKAKFKRFKGNLYFTAIPGIDEENKKLFIKDFKIEPNTNSFLINHGLPYLVDNFYYEKIKDKLKYSYKTEYDKYFDLINEKLKKIEIDKLLIEGELSKMSVPGFYIDQEGIELLLVANGKLKSTIKVE